VLALYPHNRPDLHCCRPSMPPPCGAGLVSASADENSCVAPKYVSIRSEPERPAWLQMLRRLRRNTPVLVGAGADYPRRTVAALRAGNSAGSGRLWVSQHGPDLLSAFEGGVQMGGTRGTSGLVAQAMPCPSKLQALLASSAPRFPGASEPAGVSGGTYRFPRRSVPGRYARPSACGGAPLCQ